MHRPKLKDTRQRQLVSATIVEKQREGKEEVMNESRNFEDTVVSTEPVEKTQWARTRHSRVAFLVRVS